MSNSHGFVDFTSTKGLVETGMILSQKFLGGVPFEREEGLREEVPAAAAISSVMGCCFVLYGDKKEGVGTNQGRYEFTLDIAPCQEMKDRKCADLVRLDQRLAQLLKAVPEFGDVTCTQDSLHGECSTQ